MSRFPKCVVIALAGLAASSLIGRSSSSASAQDAAFRKPLQSREEIAALPKSESFAPRSSATVRAGFAPQANQTGLAGAGQSQAGAYPYPASSPPRGAAASQPGSLSRNNNAEARFASRSFGANTATGNLGRNFGPAATTAQAQSVYNLRENSLLSNSNPTQTNPAQTNPVQTNRNQAFSNQAFSNQTNSSRVSAQSNAPTGNANNGYNNNAAFRLNRDAAAPRVSSRTPIEQQRSSTLSQTRTASSNAGQTGATTAFRQVAFQAPVCRTAQNCCCTPNHQVPNGSAGFGFNPTVAAFQAPAFQAPSLNPAVGSGIVAPQVGQGFQFQPGIGTPQFGNAQFGASQFGTPQFGAQGARWWTPFVSGSGVYTPLIRLQSLSPGTYLGQGIIGQPTAYVDGQPVRNLLRYIAP